MHWFLYSNDIKRYILVYVDNRIASSTDTAIVAKMFRYVDDYLFFTKKCATRGVTATNDVLYLFETCGDGLKFMPEVPSEGRLQFLDLHIVSNDQICWQYRAHS